MSQPDPRTPKPKLRADRAGLHHAWRAYMEDPAGAWATARACLDAGTATPDPDLAARARVLQAAIALHQGDLSAAAHHLERAAGEHSTYAAAEWAFVSAQISFLNGEYDAALSTAARAVELADLTDSLELQITARRGVCMVEGNLIPGTALDRSREVLELAITTDEPWEEAISRNDVATSLAAEGDLTAAEREARKALRVLGGEESGNRFAMALIHATLGEIRLAAGRPAEALEDAGTTRRLLGMGPTVSPYLLAETVRMQVQALGALGHVEQARRAADEVLDWLGDRAPHSRERIIEALRAAS